MDPYILRHHILSEYGKITLPVGEKRIGLPRNKGVKWDEDVREKHRHLGEPTRGL